MLVYDMVQPRMPLQRVEFASMVVAVKFTEKDDLVPLVEAMLKYASMKDLGYPEVCR